MLGQPRKYTEYEDDLYKVVGVSDKTEKNGAVLYICECKLCGEEHLRNAKHLKQGIRSRECSKYKSWNWTGLDRWDAIIRRTYGITLEEYDAKLEEQGGVCEICGKPDEVEGRRMAIDHDHDTGAVRGLLCGTCNRGLGSFMDDIETLKKATAYLIKYSNAR